MKNTRGPIIGVTLGEATGIGSELIVKTLSDDNIRNLATWVIVDNMSVFQQGQSIAGIDLAVKKIANIDEVKVENGLIHFIDIKNLDTSDYQLGTISIKSGKSTGDTLKYIVNLAKNHKIDGIIYGPLNKEALKRGGHEFQDDLHLFANLLDCKHGFGEINVMDKLWVTRVSSHIPIKDVSKKITKENVLDRIHFAHRNMKLGGVENSKIFVSALNPHCGEGGLSGTEEIDAIQPAIEQAQKDGIDVHGPYSADTILLHMENDPFDCLLAMYHDQAQIGMKLLGFNRGVTISGGLPVVLTTPAHGTAFDIAGKGVANPGPTKEAAKKAIQMTSNLALEK